MRRIESKRERRAAERRLNRGIGWRIAATRQRLGLSISDAAEHIGITPSTMRKLESGGPCLPRPVYRSVAAFNLSLNWVISGSAS
jgi:ribosome-binding protein aMBF1 (putative translation factor)